MERSLRDPLLAEVTAGLPARRERSGGGRGGRGAGGALHGLRPLVRQWLGLGCVRRASYVMRPLLLPLPPPPPLVTRLPPRDVQATAGSASLKAGGGPLHGGVESLDYEVGRP